MREGDREAGRHDCGEKCLVHRRLQVLGQSFKLAQRRACLCRARAASVHIQAVLDMIVDEFPLGVCDRAFDSMKLLREVKTGASLLEHRENRGEVAMGALESGDDGGVTGVLHIEDLSPGTGSCKLVRPHARFLPV